jgi:hypothetical protein
MDTGPSGQGPAAFSPAVAHPQNLKDRTQSERDCRVDQEEQIIRVDDRLASYSLS